MPFAALIIGAIIIVVALNGTQQDLAKELEADIPGYLKWAAAIAAILALGYVPGLKTPSRWLLALVLFVIVLKNYQAIFDGFTSLASSGVAQGSAPQEPALAYALNPSSNPLPTDQEIAGATGSAGTGTTGTAIASTPGSQSGGSNLATSFASFNPQGVVSSFSKLVGLS